MRRLIEWLQFNAAAFFLVGMVDRRLAALGLAVAFALGFALGVSR